MIFQLGLQNLVLNSVVFIFDAKSKVVMRQAELNFEPEDFSAQLIEFGAKIESACKARIREVKSKVVMSLIQEIFSLAWLGSCGYRSSSKNYLGFFTILLIILSFFA